MPFDLQTLTVGSVITTTISALFFIVIWRLTRRVAGIRIWLLAMWLQPVGWGLIALRGEVPNLLSIVLGNYLIVLSLLLFYLGIRVFFDKPLYIKRSLIAATLLFIPIQYYFTYPSPDVLARVYTVYSFAFTLMALSIISLYRLPKAVRTTGSFIYSNICVLICLLIISRLITTSNWAYQHHLYDLSVSNFIGAIISFCVPQALALGVFILAFERREQKVKKLSEQAKIESATKTRYLATLSHELRTPVNGMTGLAQIISNQIALKAISAKEIQQKLQLIVESGQQLVELADSILEYSSIDQDQAIETKNTKLDLAVFMQNIEQLLSPIAQQKAIMCTIELDANIPNSIVTDANKLRVILFNLIVNSIKYSQSNEVLVQVTRQSSELIFSVADQGVGIEADQLEQYMAPFFRGKAETSNESGAGLGLFIVKSMVQALNGQFEFAENKPQGCIFTVRLPIERAENPAPKADHITLTPPSMKERLNLLLVEDTPLNIEVVSQLLKQHKQAVTIATTGTEAKAQLQKQHFDGILLDIQLPDVKELELYHYISNTYPNTPIVLLTAAVTERDLLLYRDLSITALVKKPIIEEVLLAALIAVAEQINHQYFSPKAFKLLQVTLPDEQLNPLIEQLECKLKQQLQKIENLVFTNEKYNIERLCHDVGNYFGQFGFLQVKREIDLIPGQTPVTSDSLTKPLIALQRGLPLLRKYRLGSNERPSSYHHH